MKPRIYISGPITGRPNNNKEAFTNAKELLLSHGFEVVNPHDLETLKPHDQMSWNDYMRNDIKALMDCNLVAVLEDWHESTGARLEVELAHRLGMEVLLLPTLRPIYHSTIRRILDIPMVPAEHILNS